MIRTVAPEIRPRRAARSDCVAPIRSGIDRGRRIRHYGAVANQIETLASLTLDQIGMVVANDSARSSFTAESGNVLLALDQDLTVVGRWPLAPGPGWHASSPGRGLALMSDQKEVRLVGEDGQTRWAYAHTAWSAGSGCTWFDSTGQPHAIVPSLPYWPESLAMTPAPRFWRASQRRSGWRRPAPPYDHSRVIRFDLDSGAPAVEAPIEEPSAVYPVHHPDGWVGLSQGDPDGSSAWWVRSAGGPGGPARIEMIHAGWDDCLLADVHHSGRMIVTTPHDGGPLTVRSFPGLETVLSVDPPSANDGRLWDMHACFVGDLVVTRLIGDDERIAVINLDGQVRELEEQEEGWLVPAAEGTWLAASPTTIRRCRLSRPQDLW
jgi:hypothetical protein